MLEDWAFPDFLPFLFRPLPRGFPLPLRPPRRLPDIVEKDDWRMWKQNEVMVLDFQSRPVVIMLIVASSTIGFGIKCMVFIYVNILQSNQQQYGIYNYTERNQAAA